MAAVARDVVQSPQQVRGDAFFFLSTFNRRELLSGFPGTTIMGKIGPLKELSVNSFSFAAVNIPASTTCETEVKNYIGSLFPKSGLKLFKDSTRDPRPLFCP